MLPMHVETYRSNSDLKHKLVGTKMFMPSALICPCYPTKDYPFYVYVYSVKININKKSIYSSDVQVAFELYGQFSRLQVLYFK